MVNLRTCSLGFESKEATCRVDRAQEVTLGTDASDDRAGRIACNYYKPMRGGLGEMGTLKLFCHMSLPLLFIFDRTLLLMPF